MYTPDLNKITDQSEALSFMKRFSFATIITSVENKPIATHLPFLIKNEDSISLVSHFAKANDHWKSIEDKESLIIFNEPHSYISPKHYEKELTVPTWNYISIHAYGQGELITNDDDLSALLEHTIDTYEADYIKKWNELPNDFKSKMIKGIVGFKIEVTELQGKKKLSQNKSLAEQKKIIDTLAISDVGSERLIAEYMKKEQKDSQ